MHALTSMHAWRERDRATEREREREREGAQSLYVRSN